MRPYYGPTRRLGPGRTTPEGRPRIRRVAPAETPSSPSYSAAAAGAAVVAVSTLIVTPGPMVELSEIFFM